MSSGRHSRRRAANALQYHVSQLRKSLAPHEVIVTQEPGYLIRVGPDELDLLRFELLVEESRQVEPELAAQRLREALDLWRGPPLADLAQESFPQTESSAAKSSAWRRSSGGSRPTSRSAATPSSSVSSRYSSREHPLRERLRGRSMQALYGSGRQVEALEVYRATRRHPRRQRSESSHPGTETSSSKRSLARTWRFAAAPTEAGTAIDLVVAGDAGSARRPPRARRAARPAGLRENPGRRLSPD